MSTVLVLDDDKIFRSLLVDVLQSRGHRVLEASKSGEADLLLGEQKPDLLLVDGLLPDTTGVQWVEKLRRKGCGTPVLFVTSFWKSRRDYETVTRAIAATQFLSKPAVPEAIADRIDSMLGIAPPRAEQN